MKYHQVFIALALIAGGTFGYFYANDSTPTSRIQTNPDRSQPSARIDEKKSSSDASRKDSSDGNENIEDETDRSRDETNTEYETRRARVVRVFDGDSLKVVFPDSGDYEEIRIKGIDCPETSEEVDKCGPGGLVDLPCREQIPLGIRAKSYAKTLLEDEIVALESYNHFDRGNYGRILAYVRTPEGEDYGLKTVKKGYCNDSGRIYDHPREETYKRHRRALRR